ncbi:MAG: site-specific integrase [Planctomycetes bacterium]|nr:site-specific integrase [Planctomycetota bacterium]
MNDEPRVYVESRMRKDGSKSYRIKWLDPSTGKRGTTTVRDQKRVEYERARLLKDLTDGTHKEVRRISWSEFVADDVSKIKGKVNRTKTKRALERFGELCNPVSPRRITFVMLETFVAELEALDLAPPTINQYLRYIRAGLNRAVKRGYVAENRFDTCLFLEQEEKPPRVISDDEQAAILNAADDLYGFRMWSFIQCCLNTGGRNHSEVIPLQWSRVSLEKADGHVHFTNTKSHYDRIIPLRGDMIDVLQRLKAQPLQAGGPFIGMHNNLNRKWQRIKTAAGVDGMIVMHDLRRTFITRLIRANVPLPTVQKLAGHKDIKTTLKFYNWVSMDDRREAVEKLPKIHVAS